MKTSTVLLLASILVALCARSQGTPFGTSVLTVRPVHPITVQTNDTIRNPFASLNAGDSVHVAFLALAPQGLAMDSITIEVLDSTNTAIAQALFTGPYGDGATATRFSESLGALPYRPYLFCEARVYHAGQLIQTIQKTFSQP